MKELDDLSFEGIVRYFHSLSVFGYKSYSEVYRLLTLFFLKDILNSPLSYYIDSDDYRAIMNLLYKLYGSSCLISYPEYHRSLSLKQILNDSTLFRISEHNINRITERNTIRVV